MPLNRPPLALGPGPRSVQDARRWVVETCEAIDRPDLVECAQLGVSELVTNAVLHGEPPFSVRVRGTVEHPRVEVHDSATEVPVLPSLAARRSDLVELDELDDLLSTFGRGLTIVARSSDAWGVEIEDVGKVVWFAPAREFADDDGAPGVVTGEHHALRAARLTPGRTRVDIVGVPLKLYLGFQRHFRELRREVRLLALAHESDYPLAKDLSDLFGSLERQLRDGVGNEQVEAALADGVRETDLVVHLPRDDAEKLSRFVGLLDLADEFCREERLLSLARTPEQRRFQQWFLTELVRQAGGATPISWTEAQADGLRVAPAR